LLQNLCPVVIQGSLGLALSTSCPSSKPKSAEKTCYQCTCE